MAPDVTTPITVVQVGDGGLPCSDPQVYYLTAQQMAAFHRLLNPPAQPPGVPPSAPLPSWPSAKVKAPPGVPSNAPITKDDFEAMQMLQRLLK